MQLIRIIRAYFNNSSWHFWNRLLSISKNYTVCTKILG